MNDTKENKIAEICVKFLYICLCIVPTIIMITISSISLIGGWKYFYPRFTREHFFQPEFKNIGISVGAILLIFMIFFIFLLKNKQEQKYVALLLMFVSFIIRSIYVIIFKNSNTPFSDFAWLWDTINGSTQYLTRYRLYPTWGNYLLYCKVLHQLFGMNYFDTVMLNVIYESITAVCIYAITNRVLKKEKPGVVAALIYIFMPSAIIYNMIGTPEILAKMFIMLGIVILIADTKNIKAKGCRYLVAGILLGLGNLFKPIALVVIIALLISYIVYAILKRKAWKQVFMNIICIAAMAIVMITITNVTNRSMCESLGIEESVSTTPDFLVIGLDPKAEGQVHLCSQSDTMRKMLEQGATEEEAEKVLTKYLSDSWKMYPKDVLTLFPKKFIWAWQDDTMPSYYFKEKMISRDRNTEGQQVLYTKTNNYLPALSQIYYCVLLILALLGFMRIYRKYRDNELLFFISLYWFGFVLLLLISEAQSRYKCMILPIVCIISAIGLSAIVEKWCFKFKYFQKL